MVHQLNPHLPLWGKDEVSCELLPWVRSLEIGTVWFVENTFLLSENAKIEIV